MNDFWRGRRVFLTGHTGFKGAWMSLWLQRWGAHVTGYSLLPHTAPNLCEMLDEVALSIIGDVRHAESLATAMSDADPQVVIHMAAQALVKESYRDPLTTFGTNILGTANLLQACRRLPHLQCVVVVTSDKVYENHGNTHAFEERDRLGGHDPYSNSKACAELVTASFRASFFQQGAAIATARAGNVVGGGDWSDDRLIPDCLRALQKATPVRLRHPQAIRPWQHVLEPVSGYLALAQALVEAPAKVPLAVNFGPDPSSFCTVREVVEQFSERFSGKPGWVLDEATHAAEAPYLTLRSDLAHATLGWRPRLNVADSLAWTADWYRAFLAGDNMMEFSRAQLMRYQQLLGHSS